MKIRFLVLLLVSSIICSCSMNSSEKKSEAVSGPVDNNTIEDLMTKTEPKSSEETSEEELEGEKTGQYYEITYKDWAGETVTQPDFWLQGLINTYISSIRGTDPSFTEGITLKNTHLYSAPNEGLYDLGIIYQGRRVKLLKQVEVEYFYDDPEGERVSPLTWYLVNYTGMGYENIGYVRCDNIGDIEKVSVEPAKPWTIKAGVPIYESPNCHDKNPDVYQSAFGRIYDVSYDEDTNITQARDGNSLSVYLQGRPEEVLEPFDGLGEGTTKHGN